MIHRSEEGTANADASLIVGGIVAPTAQYVIICNNSLCAVYCACIYAFHRY